MFNSNSTISKYGPLEVLLQNHHTQTTRLQKHNGDALMRIHQVLQLTQLEPVTGRQRQ